MEGLVPVPEELLPALGMAACLGPDGSGNVVQPPTSAAGSRGPGQHKPAASQPKRSVCPKPLSAEETTLSLQMLTLLSFLAEDYLLALT